MTEQATPTQTSETATRSGSRALKLVVVLLVLLMLGFGIYEFVRPKETELDRAVTLIKHGKAASAIPFSKASRREPDNASVYPWLAQGYLATERYAESRLALDTALRLKLPAGALAPVIQSFAEYYQRRGDFSEAEKLYSSVMRAHSGKAFDAGRARLYLSWAESDMGDGKLEDAVHHLELADTLSAGVDETVKMTIPIKLSDCYRRLAAIAETVKKNDREAIKLLEKSLSVCDETITRIAIASIYARTGEISNAIENYEAVVKEDPNNLEVRHRLIELLLEKQDYDKAQVALTELTDREKSVENYELLANVNLKISNYAGAVRALEEATSLRPSVPLLEKLKATLITWSDMLQSEKKTQESVSVKGHAARVAEQLAALKGRRAGRFRREIEDKAKGWNPGKPPINILFSRNWLAKESLTPEGKIKIKNITGAPISDLTLTAVFFDNTVRKRNGSISLPVATPTSPPFEADGERWLYFSCPQTVKYEHQLAVIILWKGKFLKEFPVVKR